MSYGVETGSKMFARNEAEQPARRLSSHLSEEQMEGLLLSEATGEAGSHLRDCAACAAEVASLQQALGAFRAANTAYAEAKLPQVRPAQASARRVPHRSMQPAYWLAAAAVMAAAILPVQMLRVRTAQRPAVVAANTPVAAAAESDEALMDDISRELAVTVPASMQALDEPSGSAYSVIAQTGVEGSSRATQAGATQTLDSSDSSDSRQTRRKN